MPESNIDRPTENLVLRRLARISYLQGRLQGVHHVDSIELFVWGLDRGGKTPKEIQARSGIPLTMVNHLLIVISMKLELRELTKSEDTWILP